MPPRVRALPTASSTSSRQGRSRERRPPHPRFVLDGLGLHRIARAAIRDLQEKVVVLEALVGLLDSVGSEIFPGDEPGQLRSATTILRTTLEEIASTAIEAAVAVGQVRLVGQLRGIEIEEGPEE